MYETEDSEMNPNVIGLIIVGLVIVGAVLSVYFMSPNVTPGGTGATGALGGEGAGNAGQTTPPRTTPTPSPSPTTTVPGSTGLATSLPPPPSSESEGLSTGAIVGIVFAILAILGMGMFALRKPVGQRMAMRKYKTIGKLGQAYGEGKKQYFAFAYLFSSRDVAKMLKRIQDFVLGKLNNPDDVKAFNGNWNAVVVAFKKAEKFTAKKAQIIDDKVNILVNLVSPAQFGVFLEGAKVADPNLEGKMDAVIKNEFKYGILTEKQLQKRTKVTTPEKFKEKFGYSAKDLENLDKKELAAIAAERYKGGYKTSNEQAISNIRAKLGKEQVFEGQNSLIPTDKKERQIYFENLYRKKTGYLPTPESQGQKYKYVEPEYKFAAIGDKFNDAYFKQLEEKKKAAAEARAKKQAGWLKRSR